jgi:FkbM family methyltransferase
MTKVSDFGPIDSYEWYLNSGLTAYDLNQLKESYDTFIRIPLIEALLEAPSSAVGRSNATLSRALSAVNKYKGVVLVGAGQVGVIFLKCLQSLGIKVVAFLDNDPKKAGTTVDGVGVWPLGTGVSYFKDDYLYIVSVLKYDPQIFIDPMKIVAESNGFNITVYSYQEFCSRIWRLNRTDPAYTPAVVLENRDTVLDIYDYLSDCESKKEYSDQIFYRLGYPNTKFAPHNKLEDQYFPDDLLDFNNEVFYDCGAYDGDTIVELQKHSKSPIKEYVAFEPDPENYKNRLIQNTKVQEINGVMIQGAVGKEPGELPCTFTGTMETNINPNGTSIVKVYAIDDLLKNPAYCIPTFIKMDVEGNELDALKGAENTIKNHSPVLAICAYHRLEDIWTIPAYVKSINPSYKCFIRRYADCGWEEIFYFIPPNRLK